MYYQGRVVKFGADYILDKHGIDGIEQAISFKKNARKPLTKEECLEYLQFTDMVEQLHFCKVKQIFEPIFHHLRWYVRDIEHEAYIDYDYLYKVLPCKIPFNEYGEKVLKHAMIDRIVEQNRGLLTVKLYCPASFVFRHYVLSGSSPKALQSIQEIFMDLELVRTAVYAPIDDESDDRLYVQPFKNTDLALIFKKQS